MSNILLLHHLGLGDHIMCHGIVREYCKKYRAVTILSLPRNHNSVSFMYRDLKNLMIVTVNDTFTESSIFFNKSKLELDKYDSIKIIGFEYLNRQSGEPLEKQFYRIAGVNIEKKWNNFFVQRDLEREGVLFKQTAPQKDYVFLHEDISKNYRINRGKINKKYELYTPTEKLTGNIFDYCTIIERAKEIHVIDSSFMFLIDCLKYKNLDQKLYIHRYARENADWKLPILRKKWEIINMENYHLGFIRYVRRRLTEYKGRLISKLTRRGSIQSHNYGKALF